MSIYDNRDEPAYGRATADPSYSLNPHILRWWNQHHDASIRNRIAEDQWYWYWNITDEILAITPEEAISAWRDADPICGVYAWSNVLMYFAISRADRMGFTRALRKPKRKVCPLCGHRFLENSLPVPLVERPGIDGLEFCSPCLSAALFGESDTSSRKEVLRYLADVTEFIQRIPPQGFGQGKDDIEGFTTEELERLLRILARKPSVNRVKKLFGSWLSALISAGVLEDGTRRTSRRTQCIAKDGHVCLSLAEKTIDDLFFHHGIAHEKEYPYPGKNYRADFYASGILVEYFGLIGDPKHELRMREKKRLARKLGIRLIAVYPADLVTNKRLRSKLSPLLSSNP